MLRKKRCQTPWPSRCLTPFLPLAAAGLLAAACCSGRAAEPGGKKGGKEEQEEFDPRVFVEQDDDTAGMIRAAWRARDSGNWRLVIDKYLEANRRNLEGARKGVQPVFRQSERLYLPVTALIHRELAELPKEGLELYRLLKGREAELAYARAVEAVDDAGLERVVVEHPVLEAAPRALYLLGERCWARGHGGRAVFYWRRLLADYPGWGGAERSSVLTRAALVSVESGRPAEASALLDQLRKEAGLTRLRVGSVELLVADEIEKRLKAGTGSPGGTGEERGGSWPSIGGDSAHNGSIPVPVDAGVCRWQKKLDKHAAFGEQYRNMGVDPKSLPAVLPRRHPVCVGGMVVLAGETDVVAYRAMSGTVVWKAPAGSANEGLPTNRQTLPAIGDGRAYACCGRPRPANPYEGRMNPGGSQVSLRAFGLESGKLLWESGREEDKDAAGFLKSVDLTAAPVYAAGYVFCPAVKRGSLNDVYMLCFDAASGRLVWRTFICAAQPLAAGYYYQPVPFLEDCLPPAVGEGLVALATNAGGLAVMDAGSGQLLWIYLYDRVEQSAKSNPMFGRGGVSIPETWAANAPIISGGLLYAAPQDCPDLLAVEVSTGRLRWKARRGAMRHLVGISDGRLLLSGGREAVALSAVNGKRLWSAPLAAEESGLGLAGRDFVIVPTRTALQRLDLATGEPRASYLFKQGDLEAGNLVVSGDVIISAGGGAVAGYYAWDRIVSKLRAEIAGAPDAAAARAELGEVYFSAERYGEAAGFFKEALERAKPGETQGGLPLATTIKKNIWESYSRLGAAAEEKDGDLQAALKNYLEAHQYRTGGNEEMIGHMRFARCRQGLADFSGAVADYQAIVARLAEEPYASPGRGQVQAGRLAQTQIDRLIREKGREVYARFDGEANELLAKARAGKDADLARRIVREYPNSLAVSPALILQSELALAADKPAEAAACLREHLWKRQGSEREAEVRARLAMAYRAQGMESLCRGMLNRMLRGFPDKTFDLDGRAWSVREFVADRLPKGAAVAVGKAGALPDLTPPLATGWKVDTGDNNPNLQVIRTVPGAGEPVGMVFFRPADQSVWAVDMTSGKRAWKSPHEGGPQRMQTDALVTAGAVLAASGGKLQALSPASGKLAWEFELPIKPDPRIGSYGSVALAAGEGVVAVSMTSVGFDPQLGQSFKATIVALDEGTGQQIWTADTGAGQVLQAEISDGLLLLCSQDVRPNSRGISITAYDLADGKKRYSIPAGSYGGTREMFRVQDDLLLAFSPGAVSGYELATGKLKWRTGGGLSGGIPVLVAADESRIITIDAGGGQKTQLSAWETATGRRLWGPEGIAGQWNVQNLGYRVLVPCAGNTEKVAVCAYDYRARKQVLAAFDGKSGKLLWHSDLPMNAQWAAPVMGARHVAAIVNKAANVSELRVWELDSGKLIDSRAHSPGHLLIYQEALLVLGMGTLEHLKPAAPPASAEPGK